MKASLNRDELAGVLWAAAERCTKRHGMQLGPGADADIRRFARTGADRILDAHPQAALDDEIIKDAEAAFEKLIDEMVVSASEIAGYRQANPNTIGERTLSRALSRLCPLFPIC